MKKMFALVVSLVMVYGCGVTAYAEQSTDTPIDVTIIDEYQYTQQISSKLSISNETASCKSIVMGNSNEATKVVVTQTLQKKSGNSWSKITSWSKTFNSHMAIYSTSKSSLSSGTYRLKTVAKVYKGSAYETITIYSSTAIC